MQQLNNLLPRHKLTKKMKEASAVLAVQLHKTTSVMVLKIPV